MPKLKTTISKADFDSLDDSLKGFYVDAGDGYKLDADFEDVSGLKAKNAELLAELKKRGDIVKQFEGLDPEQAKQALEQLSKIEEEKLLSKQKFEEVLGKKQTEWEKALEKERAEKSAILTGYKQKELALTLAQKYGVRKEYLDLAAMRLDGEIEVEAANGSLALKVKNGVGDTAFDELVNGLKTSYPALFESNGASGSGASGSQGGGSGTPKTATKAEVAAMDPAAKREFYLNGGEVTG